MLEGRPSDTALEVAAARAAHLRFDPPPHLLRDDRAEALLGEDESGRIARYSDEAASWVLPENRLFLPLRARYAEDRLARAYAAGTRQLVVLGAGLDSYAFRRPPEQADLRVLEIDHPSTQRWKRGRLDALGWPDPPGLEFVSCDFERTTVSEALRGSGFRPDEPAFVTWLGVTYYLEPATTAGALAELAGLLAPRSEVVLDFLLPWEDLPERYQELREQMRAYLESVGEPHESRYRSDELRDVVLAAGFADLHVESLEALREAYFAALETQVGLSERFRLAVATR